MSATEKLLRDEARCTGTDALSRMICDERLDCLRYRTWLQERDTPDAQGTMALCGIVDDQPCAHKLPSIKSEVCMSPLPYEVTLISADVRKTLTVIAINSSLAMITALHTFPQIGGPCAIKCTPGCKLVDDEVRAA